MFESFTAKTKNRTISLLIGIGLVAGGLGGLLGVSGGAFIIPLLAFFLAFDHNRAQGVSMAIVTTLSAAGVAVYSLHHCVSLLLAAETALGCVIGAMFGVVAASMVRSIAVRRTLCVLIAIAGFKMAWDGYGMMHAMHHSGEVLSVCFTGWPAVVGIGMAAGCLSATLGVGTAIILIPMLTMMLRFPQCEAQGISLAAMIPIALAGMLKHAKAGYVDFRVVNWMAVGAIVGALIGAMIANALAPGRLEIIFGVFLVAMAALMFATGNRRSGVNE